MALDGEVRAPVARPPALAPWAAVVCTLGMHRSGTSLVSRMLNLLGVHLGPDAPVSRTGADNPTGYWEHDAIVAINDEILSRFGGRWNEPPELPSEWPREATLGDLRETARRLLAADFAAAPLWGWKDPRTCLTLPFWQDVVGPMRYVLCVRNPLAVVGSLTRRNAMSSEKAERLWLGHVRASLALTEGHPRMLVFYEDVLDDWRRELRRLAAFVGQPERGDDPSVRDAVAAFVEVGMCHHRPSIEDLVRDRRLSRSAKALYLDLALRGGENDDHVSIDTALVVAGLAAGGSHRLELPALDAERHELAAREKLYLRSIARLEATLQDLALDRDGLVRESHALRHTLDAVHASAAGRLVAFARSVLAGVLPPGTRRRRVFTAALGHVASRLPAGPRPRKVLDPRTS
jgi:Sulfotransferase family